MSTSLSSTSRTDSDITSNRFQLFNTLLWKELRETGFYGLVIMMACGFRLILGMQFFSTVGWIAQYFESTDVYVSLGKLTPVLLILVCVATSFSIEHENSSYHFLRSLPCSNSAIIASKLTACGLLVLGCCILFWPLTLNYLETGSSRTEFLTSLPATGIFMAEAFLWALCFSLREPRVIQAVLKSTIGFFLLTNGPAFLVQMSLGANPRWDGLHFWITTTARVAVAAALIVVIRRSFQRWVVEPGSPETRSTRSRSERLVKPIEHSGSYRMATTERIIWQLLKTNKIALLFAGAMSLFLVGNFYLRSFAASPLNTGQAELLWMLSLSLLGLIAGQTSKASQLLVATGVNPRRIWATNTSILLAFGLGTAIWSWFLYGPTALPRNSQIWFYVNATLISFGMGQLASLVCRSPISAYVLAIVFGFGGFVLYTLSLQAFISQIPTLITLFVVPLILFHYFIQKQTTIGQVGRRFWITAASAFALSLVPLPFLRIYEVPDADIQSIIAFESESAELALDSLDELRGIADKIVRKAKQSRDSHPTFNLEGEFALLTYPLLDCAANQRTLLQNGEGYIQDLQRWQFIQQAFTMTRRDTLRDHVIRFVEDNEYEDYPLVDKVVRKTLDWNLYFYEHQALYWWAHRPETSATDVRELIRRLEDEKEVFDLHRVFALAQHRYSLAAMTTTRDEYPRILQFPTWTNLGLSFIPWEFKRFERNTNSLLQQEWTTLSELESHYQEHDLGFPVRDNHLRYRGDLVTTYLEFFRIDNSSTLNRSLFFRRVNRLFLALVLWQKEHGSLPKNLSELEQGYLEKIPISPITGESFYLAREGLTREQYTKNNHVEFLDTDWIYMARYSNNPDGKPIGQPFIWINDPEKNNRRRNGPVQKIRAVEDFTRFSDDSNLSFWIIPIPKTGN